MYSELQSALELLCTACTQCRYNTQQYFQAVFTVYTYIDFIPSHTQTHTHIYREPEPELVSLERRDVRSFVRSLGCLSHNRNAIDSHCCLCYIHITYKNIYVCMYVATALALALALALVRVASKCDTIFVRRIVCAVRRFVVVKWISEQGAGPGSGPGLAGKQAGWQTGGITSAAAQQNKYIGLSSIQNAFGIELTL